MFQTLTHPLATVNQHNIIPLIARYHMMPQLLRERIIDNAIASVEFSPAETDLAYEEFYRTNQIQSETDLNKWLQLHSMTILQLSLTIIRPLKIQKFKQQQWGDRLKCYFLKRKSDLDVVVYSMIRVNDGDLAQELFYRISEGEQTFAEAANQYSLGIEAYTGGIMNPIGFGRLPKSLAQVLKYSNPGELFRPIALENCYVIVRLEKIISAKLNSITAKSLLDEIFETWVQEQINSFGQNYSFNYSLSQNSSISREEFVE